MKSELSVIDSAYSRPRFAAIFLRVEGEEVAVVETATSRSRHLLLEALEERKLAASQVRYVIVTHAHLDHAGGAAALLESFPSATLVAHPRAARHLIDPSRLEASARRVYGDAEFERLYGSLLPVAAERVIQPEDESSIPFGAGEFRFLHTRGHAKHHFCILDAAADAIFTGDAFGLAYPELQGGGLFVFPSTSPTDFEGEEALEAVDRIAASGAGRAMLTHFGELRDLSAARQALRGQIAFSMEIAERARGMAEEVREAFLLGELRSRYASFAALGPAGFLDKDLELNAAGLAWSVREK
ncbi:MAG TPA: MBL fold metallo-hydrolase [Rectinemataceae bacterium]|nr:MBL fold metallo-hydrolase [Rectinemataceae bacterium]